MSNIFYKVNSMTDLDGNKKEIPVAIQDKEAFIKFAKIGKSAILLFSSGDFSIEDNHAIRTSVVEDMHIWEGNITITTKNTIYQLQPVEVKYYE